MKCPKCGYLGFESGDRCRNCGYDFSLAPPAPAALDLALDRGVEQPRASLDLNRIIGDADVSGPAADLPLFVAPTETIAAAAAQAPLANPAPPLQKPVVSARSAIAEDAPLIQVPAQPRAPLGVRRATPEVPRARPRPAKPAQAGDDTLFAAPPAAVLGHKFEARHGVRGTSQDLAAPISRLAAAVVDAVLITALDAGVLYFTLKLCGLTAAETTQLPLLPLFAFFLLLNGGYFVAFTAVGGQSIGKMALGIKVITQDRESVPVGQATLRTLAYLLSALPLGAGFIAGLLSTDRLALHDRLAHTRVIRPS